MRRDAHGDQEIAGRMAGRGLALPLQPDLLAGGNAGGNLDIELLAGRQPDALLDALDRLFQRHRHGDGKIEIERDAAGIEFEGGAARAGTLPPPCGAAEHAVEDILETAAATTAGAEGVGLEAAGAGATARVAAAGKALKARLALGVDLAAIELLALVLVAEDLVGRVQLGKARLGFRIVLVGVGVMLLGELAIGALDRRSAGAPRHPQDLIGVAHPSRLLFATGYPGSAPPPRLQSVNFPAALAGLAGGALQPALVSTVDIARQEIPAGAPLRGIGLGQRGHRAPRAGFGVLPRLAGILGPLGQHVGSGIAGEGEIAFGRGRPAGARRPADRPRDVAVVQPGKGAVGPRHAAAAGADAD